MKVWIYLAAYSAAIVVPQLAARGTNIVTDTYLEAAFRFWHGISPYAPPVRGDAYAYSPIFAMLYGVFLPLAPKITAVLWAALNAAVFWYGVCRWVPLGKGTSPWIWAAIVACSMELDGSLRYQQVNALLVGMTLAGLADYAEGKLTRAGIVLGIATNFKLLPGLFVLPLLFPWKNAFAKGLAIAAVLVLLAPVLALGPAGAWEVHLAWLGSLQAQLHRPTLLDLESTLTRLGTAPAVAHALRLSVLGLSLALLAALRYRREEPFPWHAWIALGLTCLLLASPRTESPTFVLVGPAYCLIVIACLASPSPWRQLGLLATFGAIVAISLFYNDLWPRRLWNPSVWGYAPKTLGTQVLWFLLVATLVNKGRPRCSITTAS